MSKFFEDVGDVVSAPFRVVGGLVTNNPKYNSIGDIYDQTVGPSNPLADVFNNEGLNKAARLSSLPSWDELGKPGEAFAKFVDTGNSLLPPDWRPYAQPVESALLNFVPGVGPYLSAGFNTAYEGGKEQQLNKGFDWGDLGKNAAINFGTAAVSDLANKAINSANLATKSAADANTLSAFNGGKSSVLSSTANAAKSGTQAASSAIQAGQPLSLFKNALSLSSSGPGLGDAAYKAAVRSTPALANQALNETLAPNTQPISGVLDGFQGLGANDNTPHDQWGNVLNSFIGPEINTANPNGPRIDTQAFNSAVDRLGANAYLQQNQTRDSSIPAGQFEAPLNTPYQNRLNSISKNTTQSYNDLVDQVNNANKYYGVVDSNPGLTSDDLNTFLQNTNTGVLGGFNVPSDQLDFFKTLKPLGPLNTSLL